MSEVKRLNPYQVLLEDIRKFCHKVMWPKTKLMWTYLKKDLDTSWSLKDLYERTAAAEQLGWDVILKATDNGLEVKYQEKRPEPHYNWK